MNTPFTYALNTSTLCECKNARGEILSLQEKINTVGEAGYDGIELWIKELDAFTQQGGTLDQVRAWTEAANLRVVDLMGFFEWSVRDPERRRAGLAEARRNFEMAAALNCPYVAAPPFGIHAETDPAHCPTLKEIACYFADLIDHTDDLPVQPLLEFWGISKNLGCLGDSLLVAAECGREPVKLLTDVFHIYKSSGNHSGMHILDGQALGLFHVNDYPALPIRAEVNDAQRCMPGDGVAPLKKIFQTLKDTGYRGTLSLELFNAKLWAQDPATVAKLGLERMKNIAAALD